jgi:hypothetical protein
MTFDTFQTIQKDGTVKWTGICCHIAQAQAEVSGVECMVLKNGVKIFSYTPKPKKWTSYSYLWGV